VNTPAYVVGVTVAASLGAVAVMVCADAYSARRGFTWTRRGMAAAAALGVAVGVLWFYCIGHTTVMCDLRTFEAAQHCAVIWH
jgi:cytochrome c biogenesis protein CcdA